MNSTQLSLFIVCAVLFCFDLIHFSVSVETFRKDGSTQCLLILRW